MRTLSAAVGLIAAASCATVETASSPGEDAPPPLAGDVALVAADERVQAAFETIVAADAKNIERLIELTEIPAPPFGEEERGAAFADHLRALGLEDVRVDEVGNVIGRRPGRAGDRTIAVSAHLDTVFPASTDVTVRREGDTFHAPGIGDDTRGLVVVISLLEAMQSHQIETDADVLFIGTVGEEGLGNLRGVRHLFREEGEPIHSFISVDGGDIERLVFAAVGSYRYRVTFEGPGGHSYGAFGRAHPHQALADAIVRFTEAATPITAGEPKATFSVGRIGGGTSINSIPFESWMEVDMRSPDPRKLDALDAAFKEAVNAALEAENARRAANDPLTVDMNQVGLRPAGRGSGESTLVRRAIAAMELLGVEPELAASSTDSNIPIWLGV
ncbi:MAG: M20/M25/M40 family metallo-hydrolase, partial [Caulobacterales bacterium]|nr:M20/M25/M40 family metallo-hydrolase [Caulobacterales bacterium]